MSDVVNEHLRYTIELFDADHTMRSAVLNETNEYTATRLAKRILASGSDTARTITTVRMIEDNDTNHSTRVLYTVPVADFEKRTT